LKIEESVLPNALGGLIDLCCAFCFVLLRLGLFYGMYSGYFTHIPGRCRPSHVGCITIGALVSAAIHAVIGFQMLMTDSIFTRCLSARLNLGFWLSR
jgi:succinate dehydrogenase hydrophobic anchor subunit